MLNSRQLTIAKRAAHLLDQGCVIIDFETTGFPTDVGVGIVEVAVIDHRGGVLMNTLVNPERHIPSGASNVHGIHDDDVANAPTFREVFPDLMRLLNEQRAVSYNYTFEKGMLNAVCTRHSLSIPEPQWSCAMRDYAVFRGLRGFASLSKACAREGITIADAHRALGDCKMTLALLYTMAGSVS
ncbi:MAG: 3'-5' exonuclease [Anaerolineae bacterium]